MYAELKQVWQSLTGPEGNFEITTVDVRGVPTKTYKNAPPSLRELWLSSQQFADREYIVYQDERWTYARAMKGGVRRCLAGGERRGPRGLGGPGHAQLPRIHADLLGYC